MKVCLVIPPSGFQLDDRVYPMLGVLKVAAVLERSYQTRVLDLSGVPDDAFGFWLAQDYEKHGHTEVYGITATMPQMPAAVAIATVIRALSPRSRILLGGAHVTMVNAAARAGVQRSADMLQALRPFFDVLVAGDGEKAVFGAIAGDDWLIDADQPGTALFLTGDEVKAGPWPARHLIDLRSYHCFVDGVPATSMVASLGCPFRCGFCGGRNSPTYRRVRLRETADIVHEMTDIYLRWGYRAFMFLDDELNVSKAFPELLKAIAYAQQALGVEWRLCGLLKSELFTQEQAGLMYAAGFRKILIGFESGSPRILENIQKNATVEDNTRAVEMAHRAGLKVKALMSLGHPGESPQTIDDTTAWLLDSNPDEFDATVLSVYPGTPYHDEAVAHGDHWLYRSKNGDALYFESIDQLVDTPYYKGIPGEYQSYVWTDALSKGELVTKRDALEAYVRAYLKIPYPKDAAALNYEHSMGLR